MRILVVVAFACLIGSPAFADEERWSIKEGVCSDWTGTWRLTHAGDSVWTGTVEQRHVGGPCAGASGAILTANLKVIIAGRNFAAAKTNSSDGNDCNYFGTIDTHAVTGRYMCTRNAGPFTFSAER